MKKIIIFTSCAAILLGGILLYFSPWEQTVQEPVAAGETAQRVETLDDCLSFMQYLSFGAGAELDTMLEEKLLAVDKLLQSGARPTDKTRDLLPMDCHLRQRVTEILGKHGIHIMAGDNPDNPCCVPL